MKIPISFYYSTKSEQSTYSVEPPGQLDVNKMLKNKPYWKKSNFHNQLQEKKLILADWRMKHWSALEREATKRTLLRLEKEGFTIYLWNGDILTPLPKHLENSNAPTDSKLAFPDALNKQAFKQYGLLPEQILLLDDYWLQVLKEEHNQSPIRCLKSSEVSQNLAKRKLLRILQQGKPAIEIIIHDEFSENANKTLLEISSFFPQTNISNTYQTLTMLEGWAAILLNQRSLNHHGARFNLDDLQHIEHFKAHSTTSSKELNQLLVKMKELKTLSLVGCTKLSEDFSQGADLSSLTAVNLYQSSITNNGLTALIAQTPHLKKLGLADCAELDFDFKQELNLESLEELDISGCSITPPRLTRLLRNAPNLKKLDLGEAANLLGNFSQNLDLSSLQILNLNNSSLTAQILASLLVNAPKLKELYLISCPNISDNMDQKLDLSSLELLNLSESKISNNALNNLLKKTPKLKVLALNDCQELTDDFIQGLDLSALEKLDLSNTSITSQALNKLLAKSPKLKELKLNGCKQLSADFCDGVDLSSLETLNLASVSISSEILNRLLIKTPKLTELDLSCCKSLFDVFTQGVNITSLQKLNLDGSSITSPALNHLLKKTTNLTSLNLSNCSQLEDDFSQELNLSTLTTLELNNFSIAGETLNGLLTKAPNLKILDLKQYNLKPDDFENVNFSSLEQLNFRESYINSHNLNLLLKKTPNLQGLTVISCPNLTDDFSKELNLPSLEKLNISYSSISKQTLEKILPRMPNLQFLNLIESKVIIDAPLEKLLSSIPTVMKRLTQVKVSSPTEFLPLKDPVHSPKMHEQFKPTLPDFRFQFKGMNSSLNQSMIIEKLSHYLTLTNQHIALIPKLQDGICNALTHCFLEEPLFEDWLQSIAAWNGEPDKLNHAVLDPIFANLIKMVQIHQLGLNNKSEEVTYIGDNLNEFLSAAPKSFILSNPWHAIAVKYNARTKMWSVYDPNFVNGPKTCTQKELSQVVQQSLGSLIQVMGNYALPKPLIKNPSAFIRDGGLLALKGSENCNVMLQQLPPAEKLGVEALPGLMLRNNKGVPAWAIALKEPMTCLYTLELMQLFVQCHPQDYKVRLEQSLENLSPYARHEYLSALQGLPPSHQKLANLVSNVLRDASATTNYQKALATWLKENSNAPSPHAYCHYLLQGDKRRQLVELNDNEDVFTLECLLERHAQQTSRPVFYIDSPEDLVCSAPFIKHQGLEGVLQPGPGGRLYDFLMAHQNTKPAPLLLVNYNNFETDDIVRFNQLLDEKAYADGTPLPPSMQIIGLINPHKTDAYQGEDFYSRFDKISTCAFSGSQLNSELASLPVVLASDNPDNTPINLFHANDWQERLLGKWVIHQDKLVFEEGSLANALKNDLPIIIHNGLWDDPLFKQFWQQAFLRGFIDTDVGRLTIPKTLQLGKLEGYDWDSLAAQISFTTTPTADARPLNPSLLSEFFQSYSCDNQKKTLDTLPGLLANHANRHLEIHVTRNLSEDEWALLLDACREKNINLTCSLAPSVILPVPMQHLFTPSKPSSLAPWKGNSKEATIVLESNEIDATVAMLTQKDKDWLIIDVSECESSDLLKHLKSDFKSDTLTFEFTQTTKFLLNALENKQKVLLKGHFSAELSDALASLLLQRQASDHNLGQLILLSNDTTQFDYLARQKHDVDAHEKLDVLKHSFSEKEINQLEKIVIENESLSQLKARLNYLQHHPTGNTDEAWQGVYRLPEKIQLKDFSAEQSAHIAKEFTKQRLDAVNQILTYAPYVFLTGLTGVGKSTFVEKNLKGMDRILYQGESRIKEWAQDDTTKQKILFIDEANLSPRQWSEFDGLFQDPPGILIEGQYYPLNKNHKVIFAGNPLSYGDERSLAPFFARHGNALVFEPMPQEFIYEEILKPIFEDSALADNSLALCQSMLAVYRFICEHAEDKVLISPRELQMMALLVISHVQQNPTLSPEDSLQAAQHYTYQLASQLVPASLRESLDKQFKPQIPLVPKQKPFTVAGEFMVTPSRQNVSQQLDDLLNLRTFRYTHAVNETQKYGGLGGIILEGEPGIGKSDLVLASLNAQGYEEVHDTSKAAGANSFYRIPVSMQTEDKKRLLLKAFDEGAVVIIDEINSSPMMERLLNDLLMGKTPEGNRPTYPGFLVIGTQNPVTMAGRRPASTALQRRLITTVLSPYTTEEMKTILINKGLPSDTASSMVLAYQENVKKAQQDHLTPAPTFRDLMRLAKQIINANEYSEEEMIQKGEEIKEHPDQQESEEPLNKKEKISKITIQLDVLLQNIQQLKKQKNHSVEAKVAQDIYDGIHRSFAEYQTGKIDEKLFQQRAREVVTDNLGQSSNIKKTEGIFSDLLGKVYSLMPSPYTIGKQFTLFKAKPDSTEKIHTLMSLIDPDFSSGINGGRNKPHS